MSDNGKMVNGHLKEDIHQIKDDVRELKDDLGPAVMKLQRSVDALAISVNALTNQFGVWIETAKTLIPLTFVRTLFVWIFFMVAGMLFGVEAIRWFFKSYLGSP